MASARGSSEILIADDQGMFENVGLSLGSSGAGTD